MRYNTFDAAYPQILADVYTNFEFENAPRGHRSREKLAYHFQIADPTQRIYLGSERRTNVVFNFAEVLWYLRGCDDLAAISYYNRLMPNYSQDGKTLTGTAYGPRIFGTTSGQKSQWQQVKALLQSDPDTKRAVLQIYNGAELADAGNPDVACTLGLQFFVRDGRLCLMSHMRANDAFRGMISDVFAFTFMQEVMANDLGYHVGTYYHQAATLHIYEPDNRAVDRVLATQHRSAARLLFPKMPANDVWHSLQVVQAYEKKLRHGEAITWQVIVELGVAEYWQQIILLFALYQNIHRHEKVDQGLWPHLWPVYRQLLVAKWPAACELGESD